jgi:hypothetical protein
MIYQCFGFEDYNSVHLSEEFIMLKELLYTGIGGALLFKERVEEELKKLEEKGKLNATDSKSFLEGLQTRGEDEEKRLKELVGHTPIQVIGGFLFGIVWALLLY